MKREFLVIAALVAISACSKSEPPPAAPAPTPATEPAAAIAEPTFVNRAWVVAESKQVAVGSLRVFLSDGTLVMADPNAKPAYGNWSQADGRLKITEEGLTYEAEILEASETALRIRMYSPGAPVEIRFEPAKQTQAAIARTVAPAVEEEKPAPVTPSALLGTAWRLEDLAGAGIVDRTQATLAFPEEGRANGNGSCNRFNGVVTVDGDTISFGGIAATRMACAEAVMKQEDAYFAALNDAERFEFDGETLAIHAVGRTEPLRFVAAEAPAQRTGISAAPTPAATTSALAGIWTVVAHHSPGTSAQGDDEAIARYGETLRLTTSTAISSTQRCREPGYTTSRVAGESWLASEYKLARGSIKPLAGRDQIQLMRVSCGGQPWTAFGGLLLEIDANRALAPWDGVFFELRRDRDFRGIGQEPGWQLEIRKGSEMRFVYDYGKNMAVTPAPKAQIGSDGGTRTYHAVAESNDLRVVIVPVSCTDSMSGKPFPATVSVTLNGQTYRGCGEELATPFQG